VVSTLVISLIRLTTINMEDSSDFTYDTWASSCYSVAELASGITCAALATLSPLVTRVFSSCLPEPRAAVPARARFSKRPPTIGSGPSRKKAAGFGKDEKEWALDIYDLDLESLPSLPGTPRPDIVMGGHEYESKVNLSREAPEPLGTTFGSVTQVMSLVPQRQSVFLSLDTSLLGGSPTESGIMVERRVEVFISDAPPTGS
jgi:hypothetical protein